MLPWPIQPGIRTINNTRGINYRGGHPGRMTRGRLYAIVAALIKDPIRDMINPAIERIWLCVVEGRATTAAAGVVGVVAEAGGGGGVVWLLNLGLMRQRSKGCVWKVGKRRESQSITLWML